MRSPTSRLVLALLVASFALLPAFAEATPEAQPYLDKLTQLYEKGPFRTDMTMSISQKQMGMQVNIEAKGSMIVAGPRKSRLELDMRMSGMGGSSQAMEMRSVQVADGETMWLQTQMPAMGSNQVMKVRLDKLAELSAAGGAVPGAVSDPLSQMKELVKKFDVSLAGVEGGRATLRLEPKPELLEEAQKGREGADTPDMSMRIVVDEKSGKPISMSMGGTEPWMRATYDDFRFIEEGDIPPGTFSFTPPEGVQVIDLEQMQGMGFGG